MLLDAVEPAGDRVQVDEHSGLTRERGDGLQVPGLDVGGGEALEVLDVHGVHGAAVGVDADEEVLLRLEVDEDLRDGGVV